MDVSTAAFNSLIELCDIELKKARKGRKNVEEIVDKDLAELCSEYKGRLDQDTLDRFKEENRKRLIILKKGGYDKVISTLGSIRNELYSVV